jgi:predicted ribosome quality control (RQC) complex YloA/Tae2 family protein
MKKQLSSIEVHFITKELKQLEGSRVDKVYHPEPNMLIFSLHKSNEGKKLVNISIGTAAYIASAKEDSEGLLGFGQLLRKHLDGYFLDEIAQIEPERILKLSFRAKDDKKLLYIEFFGKGNAILCDANSKIINALEHHEFKDRTIKPKLQYKWPSMKNNLFRMDEEKMLEAFHSSKKDSIVTCLATEFGMGGIYAEEACTLAGIDKKSNPNTIKDAKQACKAIKKILSPEIKPEIIYENGNIIDAVPFSLGAYSDKEKKQFESFSSSLEFFYSNFKEIKESEHDKALNRLARIIEEQKDSIKSLRIDEKEAREKGELIYQKYADVREIIDELNKASKKHSWKEIKEKLKGHKTIIEMNDRERKATIEFQ